MWAIFIHRLTSADARNASALIADGILSSKSLAIFWINLLMFSRSASVENSSWLRSGARCAYPNPSGHGFPRETTLFATALTFGSGALI
jgi:hypothetical protein